jgi:hypothetical protein
MANDLESSIRELAESRARKVELAEWLTSGLRVRASEPPVTIVEAPQRDESEILWMSQPKDMSAAAVAFIPALEAELDEPAAEAEEPGADAPLLEQEALLTSAPTPRVPGVELSPVSETPDTLQPHLLSKELDEDDFAVLPSKPSLRVLGSAFSKLPLGAAWHGVQRRPAIRRSLAAAAVLLLFVGLTLVRRSPAPAQAQTELAAVRSESAALLPPPPPESEVVDEAPPSDTPAAASKGQGRGRRVTPPVALAEGEDDGPRGPSVARYPDLPNRVLSRLAKTQDTARHSESEPEPEASAGGEERPTWLLDP